MTSAHHISNSTDVIPNLTDVSQASRRTSRISAARYGVLRYQVAMWGSVACAEGSSEQLSRLPSGQEQARRGVSYPKTHTQGVTPVLCRMALHLDTAIG